MSVNKNLAVALTAYDEAISTAEATIRTVFSDSSERAIMLLNLAELHLMVNMPWKAEAEYLEALHYCSDLNDQVYIYNALSGIHSSMGRVHESKKESLKAEQLKLIASSISVASEKF